MKKLAIGLIGLLVLFLVGVYVFIPSKINTTSEVVVGATQRPVQEFLLQEKGWNAWFPALTPVNTSQKIFAYKRHLYHIAEQYMTGVIIGVIKGDEHFAGLVSLIPLGKDSIKISWAQTVETGINPFQRITRYYTARTLKSNMDEILQRFGSFISEEKNVYHITVQHEIVSDTLLITTKMILQREPEQADIYRLVDKLQQFAVKEGAQVTHPPMSHSRRAETDPDHNIELMVALPVNKVLPNEGDIAFKRMVPANILVTEVRGGPAAIRESFKQLDTYVQDHHYDSPAIPFESMITHRLRQPDTAKWVTKIYYPIL